MQHERRALAAICAELPTQGQPVGALERGYCLDCGSLATGRK